jgi:putative intracellular protease/amidase
MEAIVMRQEKKILIVVTNVPEYEKVGYRTGLWLGELTHFWDVAEGAGYPMEIVSPSGGYVPLDPESLILSEVGHAVGMQGELSQRYEDRGFMNLLRNTQKVSDVDTGRYYAIYLTGGHGVMFDFPQDLALAHLVAQFYESDKIVAAVCHGPAGLLQAKLSDGDFLIKGKKVTGFSWHEELLAKRDHAVPFSLEEELQRRGAKYRKSLVPFTSYVLEDGRLITGQNPASAKAVGKAVVGKLKVS